MDKLQATYDYLKERGSEGVGNDVNEFRTKIQGDSATRAAVYNYLKDNGSEGIGNDPDEFLSIVVPPTQVPAQVQAPAQTDTAKATQRKDPRNMTAADFQAQVQEGTKKAKTPSIMDAAGTVKSKRIDPRNMTAADFQAQVQEGLKEMQTKREAAQAAYNAPTTQAVIKQTVRLKDRFKNLKAVEDKYYDTDKNRAKAVKLASGQETEISPTLFKSYVDKMTMSRNTWNTTLDGTGTDEGYAAYKKNVEANAVRQIQKDNHRAINAGISILKETEDIQKNAERDLKGNALERSFIGGYGRGFGDKFDASTWTFGVRDRQDSKALLKAVDKAEAGEELTPIEEDLLEAAAVNMATKAYLSSTQGRGYKAGTVSSESLPFMLEMLVNPASTVGSTIGSKVARWAIRKFGTKGAAQILGMGARVAGDVVGAGIMTATTGEAGVAADSNRRQIGNIQFDVDEQGNAVFVTATDREKASTALWKAYGSQAIERHSEMVGEYFAPMIGRVAKGARAINTKIGLSKVNDFIDNINASEWAKIVSDFMKETKWHGNFGEFAEEIFGGVENALLIGDQTIDADKDTGVFNPSQMLDTFLGVAGMGVVVSGVKTLGYKSEKAKSQQAYDEATKNAQTLFGDKWEDLQAKLIESTPEEMRKIAAEVIANPDYSTEQKRAMLSYAKADIQYTTARKMDERFSSEQTDAMNGYLNTYEEAVSGQQSADVTTIMEEKALRNKLADAFGVEPELFDATYFAYYNDYHQQAAKMAKEHPELADDINTYLINRARITGTEQKYQNEIDRSKAAITDGIKKLTYKNQIISATGKDKEHYFIVDAENAEITSETGEQGSSYRIKQKEGADNMIIIRNSNGEVKPMAISDIQYIIDIEDAEQAIANSIATETESVNNRMATELYNQGRYQPGQTVSIEGESLVVVAADNDNVTIEDAEGKKEVVPARTLREIVNASILKEKYGEERANEIIAGLERKPIQQAIQTDTQTQIDQQPIESGDIIEITAEDGRKVNITVTQQDAEGNYFVEPEDGQPIVNGEVMPLLSVAQINDMRYVEPVEQQEPIQQELIEQAPEEITEEAPVISTQETEPQISPEEQERIKAEDAISNEDLNATITDVFKQLERAKKEAKKPISLENTKQVKARQKAQEAIIRYQAIYDKYDAIKKRREANAKPIQTQSLTDAIAQRDAARAAADEERKQMGFNVAGESAKSKWNSAPKIAGNAAVKTLPNGKTIKGHYILAPAEAATPSHNALDAFTMSAGFPVNEQGKTVNDRDYQADQAAQIFTEKQVAANYDGQAVEQVPTVSPDGIVYDGNGRVMGSQLAAQNGTDVKYMEALRTNAANFGFSPEQVDQVPNARVMFVTDEVLPYTTETFAQFNANEKKAQNATEKAVANSKKLTDDNVNEIADILDSYSSVDSFFESEKGSGEMVMAMQKAGLIGANDVAGLMDGNKFSATGREFVTSIMLGSTFSEKQIREMGGNKSLKNAILRAFKPIVSNSRIADYKLKNEIGNAISLIYEAKQAGNDVALHLMQKDMFQEDTNERYSEFEQRLALALEDGVETFRDVLNTYNEKALTLSGGQIDIFSGTVTTKDELKQQIIDYYNAKRNRGSESVQGNVAESTSNGRAADESGRAKPVTVGGEGTEQNQGDKNITPGASVQGSVGQETARKSREIADVERRRQEAKENPVPEPIPYKEAVEEYKSTDLGSNKDAKRKKQRVVDEAQTKEGRAFVENQVAQLETNDDGTITVYRSGTMQEGHNPATTDKNTAEVIAAERKKQGLSSDIIEVRVQPTDISAIIPGIESEVFIKINADNKNRISDSTKKPQKTKNQIIKEKENVKIELDEVKQNLLKLNEDFKNGKFPFSEKVYNETKTRQEQKIKNLEWQLTKYDAELAALESQPSETSPASEESNVSEEGRKTEQNDIKSKKVDIEKNEIESTIVDRGKFKGKTRRVFEEKSIEEVEGDKIVVTKYSVKVGDRDVSLGGRTMTIKEFREEFPISDVMKTDEDTFYDAWEDDDKITIFKIKEAPDGSRFNSVAEIKIGEDILTIPIKKNNAKYDAELEQYTTNTNIAEAEAEVNTDPTEGQKKAGNYKMGHVKIDGYDITIENPKGSVRKGVDESGKAWKNKMNNTYGYIKGTQSVDGDHIDIFLSDNPAEGNVFVVDQVNPKTGEFDEHKVLYGFNSADEARNAYLSNYAKNWKGLGNITEVSKEDFKKWVDSSHRKTKPFAEYSAFIDKSEPIIQGTGKTANQIKEIVREYIASALSDNNIGEDEYEIIDIAVVGSRSRGKGREDSDLDVVVEYKGKLREDNMFNMLNDETLGVLYINGARVDINPITEGKSGTLKQWLKRSEAYAQEQEEVNPNVKDPKLAKAEEEANAALDDFLKSFNELNTDTLGIIDNSAEKQAKMLVSGTKMVGAFVKLGYYKFADIVKQLQAKGIQITDDLLSAIKKAYGAFSAENDIDALDDMKTVRKFTLNDLAENNNEDLTQKENNSKKSNVSLNDKKFFKEHVVFGTIPKTNDNGQPRSTEVIEGEAAVSETTSAAITNSASNVGSDKQRAGEVKERATEQIKSVESLLAEVDNKLANLRLTDKSYSTEGIAADYPINVLAKGEIKKDLTKYIKAVAEITGLAHDTNKKGKTEIVNVNIAPAGGDATFFLWSKTNPEHGVYVSIPYDPDINSGGWYDNYKVLNEGWRAHILYRVVNKAKKYDGSNQYMPTNVTAQEMAETLLKGINAELKSKGLAEEQVQDTKQNTGLKITKTTNDNGNSKQRVLQGSNKRLSGTAQPDLFSGVDSGEGTGGSVGTQSNAVSGTDAAEQQPTGRTGNVLSGNVDVLTPALVPFNAEDNDTQSFNQSRKYDDNIAAIETLITLVKENRKATPDEKAILSNYVGFGGLKDIVLNPESAEGWKESNLKYRAQVKRIVELATEFDQVTGSSDSLAKIKGSILNAHFTSSSVIRSVYDGIQKLGFKGGRILEPSAGIGNFITYAPERIKANSNITAVELDNLTGNILKYLHDDVNVKVTGIQDAQIPNNSQDLVISNVPFGNYKIFDKALKGEKAEFQNRIHNYFFAKAIDMAREGGIIAFVTSKGVMDAVGNESLRKYLNNNAEFLGAVRLPNNAFKNNANTEVVTDIIFLKKNTTGAKNNPDFVSIKQVETTHKDGEKQMVNVNNYFVENPQNMLGNIVAGGLYSREDYTVENKTGYDLSKAIKNALPAGVYEKVNSKIGLQANDSQQTIDAIKEGNIEVTGGRVVRKEEGQLSDIRINEPQGKIEHYIRLRNALMNLIYSEYLGKPDSELNAIRQQLNTEYDTFVKKHGKLSKNAIKIAKQDADGFNVLSLEVADKKGGKADIFRQRTIQPIQNKLTAESVDEAIVISLYENASIDVERIAELLNKTVPEVLQQAKGKIFEQPEGGFVTREEYLSGNVKAKLRQAQEAVDKGFSEFAYNVEQLMDVIPADIPAMHIEARLGSRWIPQEVYTEFAQHLFNTPSAKVIYQRSIDAYSNNGRVETVEARSKWGTARRNGSDILLDALHINPPKIFDTIKEYGQEKRVLNQDETKKAVEKYEEIRSEFENWVYKAEERRTLLARIYNEKYNTTVKRSYNGDHLNIAGINGVELRPHQKDAVWMLLQNNGGIIDHLVGAGKTLVMVAGTMEMKRTGIAKKPMIIALKSTIPQIVETYRKAYPMAKILAPLEKDFTKDNRRKLFSQIANNEWDVIIMSHENYGKIPHEADIQRDFLRAEMQEIKDERGELEAAGEIRALKGLEIRLKNLEARLEKISDIDKDNSLTFEQMGIDHIMVDESQQFKNLSYVTKQRGVAGLSKAEGSKRAFNLFIGVRYLQQKYGEDKGTTFLSGTPISNSMVEMYLLLKYLRPGKMAELGFNSFDAWATTFASPNSDIEFTVTGDFKSKTRFREFINVPELSMLYTEIADIRTDANTPLDKPKMKGGGYSVVEIKMSDDQIEYGQRLMEFARTKDGHHIGMTLTKNQETAAMLLATNLSSKMAIDMRLIDPSYEYDPNGKIAKLVDNVERIYNETSEHKGTQLIFSDLGTPKSKTNKTAGLRDYMEDEMGVNLDTLNEIFGNPDESGYKYPSINSIREKLSSILELTDAEIDNIISESEQSEGAFNVYGEVRKRLVEKGIPEEQVVFIHDYNSQRAKEKLFKQVQNGEIRIVLGSTQKLGTGVNVQDRVVAVHHLDVPWTPASMEQRNGRALRQGNWVAKNHYGNELPIYAYATERTLDAYKYQLLQTKQRFLDQVKSGDVEERTVRESDGDSESGVGYAELVAMLSGNTDILLKAKLETLVQKLTKSKRNYLSEIYEAQDKKQKLTDRIPVIESNIAKTTENIEIIANAVQYAEDGKMIVADINGETLIVKNDKGKVVPTERVDYGKRAVEIAKAKLNGASYENIVKLFSLNGFDFYGSKRNEIAMNNGMFGHGEKRYIVLRAKNGVEYNITYSETPGILLNNIQKAIQGIPAILTTQNAILDKANKDVTAYQEIINKGTEWEKEPELQKAITELKEVAKRLDDISTKDQPKTASESDAVSDDKIRIGDLIFTIGKESFVTMAEAKNKAGEDVAVVRINSQLSNEDYTRRVKPIIGNYFGEWNSSNKVIMFKSIKLAENFKITIENEFKKENREYEAPQFQVISPIGFYSTVEKALESINQAKGTKEQFKQMLLKNGAKQAEMDWMGFDELPEKLTKVDIQEWIDQNRIEVEEVEKGASSKVEVKSIEPVSEKYATVFTVTFSDNSTVEVDLSGKYDNDSSDISEREIVEEAQRLREEDDLTYEGDEEINPTKYSQYVLPGGENYRELLLTMPKDKGLLWKQNKAGLWAYFVGDKQVSDGVPDNTYKEIARKTINSRDVLESRKATFKSGHFDEPNILAHVRFNEREVNGERVLFLEEIQSDWAQKGKKEGFKSDKDKLFKELESKGIYQDKKSSLETSFIDKDGKQIYHPNSNVEQNATPEQDGAIDKFFIEYQRLSNASVPNMPFKKTDQWVNLSLRRMMMYAAENGYDRIAWTTGEQQAERYDLSKQVDEIEVNEEKAGNLGRYIAVSTGGNSKAFAFFNHDGIITSTGGHNLFDNAKGKHLSDVIGKELTQRVIESNNGAILKGSDLKVGGQGMKAFYDGIVPSAMSKLGKPFGAKVENVSINTIGVVQSIPVTESMKESVMSGVPLFEIADETLSNGTEEQQALTSAIIERLKGQGIDVVRATPEMVDKVLGDRESVTFNKNYQLLKDLSGQVYGWTDGKTIFLTDKGFNPNTPIHEYTHIWAAAVKKNAPALWANIKELMQQTPMWKEVVSDEAYSSLKENDICSEALSRLSGSRNAKTLSDMQSKMMDEAGKDVLDIADAANLFNRVKKAISDFWSWVGENLFNIKKFKNAEEVADRVLYDLINKTDLKANTIKDITKLRDIASNLMKKDLSLYKTKDGREIKFKKLNEKEEIEKVRDDKAGSGTVDTSTGSNGVQREEDSLLTYKLRRLEDGEFCNVERIFTENGYFSFTSGEKIESVEDIAYIFSDLETKSIENSFALFVKDGKPTVLHLCIGAFNQTMVSVPPIKLAYDTIKPDQVYLVHNHPSGSVFASDADVKILKAINKALRTEAKGIIIDTTSGKFGVFYASGRGESKAKTESSPNQLSIPIKVYSFDRQVFIKDYNPTGARIHKEEDVAAFISSHRLGKRNKVNMLILSNAGNVVANLFTDKTMINRRDEDFAHEIVNSITAFGGSSVILYGDFEASLTGIAFLKNEIEAISTNQFRLLDFVTIEGLNSQEEKEESLLKEPTTDNYSESKAFHQDIAENGIKILSDQKADGMLNDIYKNITSKERDIIRGLISDGLNKADAIRKWMSDFAANGWNDTANAEIRSTIIDAIAKNVESGYMSANDARFTAWRFGKDDTASYEDFADMVSMELETRTGAYVKQSEETGSDYPRPKLVPDQSKELYERTIGKKWFKFFEAWFVGGASVEEMQKAIEQATNTTISDANNVAMVMSHQQSINQGKIENFINRYYTPLIETIGEIKKKLGISGEAVEDYMMMKHGLERNIKLAFRDALRDKHAIGRGQLDYEGIDANNAAYGADQEKKDNDIEYAKGDISYEQHRAVDDVIRERYAPGYLMYRNKDYSGLMTVTEAESLLDAELQALEAVLEFERRAGDLKDNLWSRVKAATTHTTKVNYDSGVISRGTYRRLNDMFEYYIPLKGFDELTSNDVYEYMGPDHSLFTATMKGAKGRASKADSPLAMIGSDAVASIMRGSKNLLKQRLYRIAVNNPSQLLTTKAMWFVKGPNGWHPAAPDFSSLKETASATEYNALIDDFEKRMEELEKDGQATQKIQGLKMDLITLPEYAQEHVVRVMVNGKEKMVYINANPRAAQAVNGTLRKQDVDGMHKFIYEFSRQLAANFTTRSIKFIGRNAIKDTLFAHAMISINEGKEYRNRFNRTQARLLNPLSKKNIRMSTLLYRLKKDTLDMSDPIQRYFKEFSQFGGETGYSRLLGVEDFREIIRKSYKAIDGGVPATVESAWEKFNEVINFANRMAEVVNRFAVYMTSREMGRSIDRSIHDAKEVTANFNEKGIGDKTGISNFFKTMYLFVNAALQSLRKLATSYAHNPGRATWVTGKYIAAGFMIPMMNKMIFAMLGDDGDDEWYYLLPKYTRRNNICLTTPDIAVTMPLPIELRAYYALGEIISSLISGDYVSDDDWMDLATIILDSTLPKSPIDRNVSIMTKVTPDFLAPIMQAYVTNENFVGNPIYKKMASKNAPEFTRVYDRTGKMYIKVSKTLNTIGGGDDVHRGAEITQLNPAKMEHVIEGYLGGALTSIKDPIMMFIDFINGDDKVDARNIPVLNGVTYSLSDRDIDRIEKETGVRMDKNARDDIKISRKTRDAHRRYKDEYAMLNHDFKGYSNIADKDEDARAKLDEFVKSEDYKRMSSLKALLSEIRKWERFIDNVEKGEIDVGDDVLLQYRVNRAKAYRNLEDTMTSLYGDK